MNEDKATRYQRARRRGATAGVAWGAMLLVGLMVTGASVSMRAGAEWLAGFAPAGVRTNVVVVLYVVALASLSEVGSLPIAFVAGFELERRYGLSEERAGAWVRDQFKGFAVRLLFGIVAAIVVYACIRRSPAGWWLPAGAVFAVLSAALTSLAPVLLLPLFYRVRPIEDGALRRRLLALAERAGTRVIGIYEWGLGEKTRRANAALAGLGMTRRILVSDTMLAEYSEEEVEVVMAHELAHHVQGDLWKGLLVESVLLLAGFMAAARLLQTSLGSFGLQAATDVAGLPLVVLAIGAVSLVTLPGVFAVSRFHERRADRVALELTNNPDAFVAAIRRLGAQNLAEDRPSTLVKWLFCSHPPTGERIAVARAFQGSIATHGGRGATWTAASGEHRRPVR